VANDQRKERHMQNPTIERERARAEQVPVTARLPLELRDQVIARALELDMTMSALVRQALRRLLADPGWSSN
jgi:hypothetical protein